MTKHYEITLSENQLNIVKDSLELYSRIFLGQLEEIIWKSKKIGAFPLCTDIDRENANQLIGSLKMWLLKTSTPTGSYGAMSENVPNCIRSAIEIFETIQYKYNLDNIMDPLKVETTTSLNRPIKLNEDGEELPVIKLIEDIK